ncbi:MAG: response regulator, partial [Elusimicrobia bacterium]|nr:response regulator [Elusimicrobiota bacterium]
IPSLVLLDLKIPGIDGLRVCQMIRKDENLKKIKILAISGNAVEEARKQILAAGANDFLAKPFGIDELSAKLEKLIPRS